MGKLGKLEGRFGRIGGLAAQGVRNAGANLTRLGIGAAGAISLMVRGGISSLAELEDATTSVQGAINQVGPTWQVTAQTVATWANEIEASVDAAFDDKAITQASQTLIRYGKVSESNLRPAMVVMTDLAARTGDVDSAATLLAKALADPTKAAGKLARQGIILTKQQQDQIKAMVEAGDAAGAQAFLLGELEKSTKGAADAMAGPYRDALNTMGDASEDIQRLLGEGFLPVIQKVAKLLREKMLDPAFMGQVKAFGQTLARAFDKLLEVGGRIPWSQIGDSLKIAGAGAKALFDAFTMLPPWVQTAVLTGWGLNKLTGGALGGIVSELAKGLVRGVLNMAAGVVNIKAGTVIGGGAPGGAPGAVPVGAKPGGLSALGKVFLVGEAIGLVLAVKGVADSITASGVAQAQEIGTVLTESLKTASTAEMQIKLDAINTGIARLKADPIAAALVTGPIIAQLEAQRSETLTAMSNQALISHRAGEKVDLSKQATVGAIQATSAAERDRLEANRIATQTGLTSLRTTTQTLSAAEQARLAAIRERAEATRIAVQGVQRTTAGVSRSVERGDGAVVNAIRNIPRPIVNVFVSGAARLAAINYQSAVPTRRGPLEDETRR